MMKIKNMTLFLILLIFFCDNNKMTEECRYEAGDYLRFFMCQESEDCVDKALIGYEVEGDFKVKSANSEAQLTEGQYGPTYQFKYTTLIDPAEGTIYKLYSSIPLPLNPGETYKLYNSYVSPFPGILDALSSVLKIYDREGNLLFASSTNFGVERFLDVEGISIEQLRGICPPQENTRNIAVKFLCGEESLNLYQSQEGLLPCKGSEYEVHLNIAWELKNNEELPQDYPYNNPLVSFYIIRR